MKILEENRYKETHEVNLANNIFKDDCNQWKNMKNRPVGLY